MINFVEALNMLLHRPEGEKVQVLYVRLANGKILVFLGAPVTPEDADQVQSITFGEQIPPALVGLTVGAFGMNEGSLAQ